MFARVGLNPHQRTKNLDDEHLYLALHKKDLWICFVLMLVAAIVIFWRLGEGSLSDYDEADYAQSAREMLWTSDFNTPRWNGMEFFDKPPLCQWLTAMAYKFFGVNEFSARFVSACAGVCAVLLVYILGRDLFRLRVVGLGASIILLTVSRNLFSHGYNFVSLARVGMLDMPLILAMIAAIWFVWRSQRDAKYLIWLGVPLGLGLMIKSVAGFIAYGIVALYFLIALPRSVWWRKETMLGWLLSMLIAAPWHLGQLWIWGRQFWDSYMVSLTVGYVTGEQGHTRDWLFYFRTIQRGFPVLYPLVAMSALYGLYRAARYRDKAVTLLLCWTAVPMVLYNVSRSRIGWYMIPIYPALALLTMYLLVTVFSTTWVRVVRRDFACHALVPSILALAVVLGATLAFNPWLPRANDFNPDVKAVASYSRYVLDEDAIVVNYWPGSYWIRPSALFYADRPFLLVTSAMALHRLLTTPGKFYVLADWVHWEPLQDLGCIMYRSNGYVLVRVLSEEMGENQ